MADWQKAVQAFGDYLGLFATEHPWLTGLYAYVFVATIATGVMLGFWFSSVAELKNYALTGTAALRPSVRACVKAISDCLLNSVAGLVATTSIGFWLGKVDGLDFSLEDKAPALLGTAGAFFLVGLWLAAISTDRAK